MLAASRTRSGAASRRRERRLPFSLLHLPGRVKVGANTCSLLAEESPPDAFCASTSPASGEGEKGRMEGDEQRAAAGDNDDKKSRVGLSDSNVDFSITISSRPSMWASRSSKNKMHSPFSARRLPVVSRRQRRPQAGRSRGYARMSGVPSAKTRRAPG